ncbi:MAG: ArgR family transcriptional regulator [Bdellovibrionia bacterium]
MSEQVDTRSEAQERLLVLRELIREGTAYTQDDLCKALRSKKFDVTQSTVSRDLRRIGAIKSVNEEGDVTYRLPEDMIPMSPMMMNDFSGLVTEIEANETMIVLHTSPGSASLVARHLDSVRVSIGILGTIAGDDAIFVVPASIRKIAPVIRKIKAEF